MKRERSPRPDPPQPQHTRAPLSCGTGCLRGDRPFPSDLAQIHNALGFGYLSTDKLDEAIAEFSKATELQPGYVTAWNNLGDALEQKKDPKGAMEAKP